MGSGWGKTAEKRGLKVQSPISGTGVILESKKKTDVGRNVLMADMFSTSHSIQEKLHKRKHDLQDAFKFVGGGPKNYGYTRGSTI